MQAELKFAYLLLALAVFSVLLSLLAGRMERPVLHVFSRWLRWWLFAALFAFLLDVFALSFRPAWVHFVTGLALWFVLDTGYNWLAIKALSRSELPLFPSFRENADRDEWPAEEHFIDMKEWLKIKGYQRVEALKAELFEGTYLRASIYESADGLIRIQILFLPKRQGGSTACYSIQTFTEDGQRLITDNQFLPYGGYYPDNWQLVRKPLIGSLIQLLALHQQRVDNCDIQAIPSENSPLEDMNEQQRILERLNLKTGFLVPRPQQEEAGKISSNGRYRLWKEMWLLAYLGKSVV